MSEVPEEPSADARIVAKHLRQMYLGLKAQGFDEDQTMRILKMMLDDAKDEIL